MTDILSAGQMTDEERSDRARKAVKVFRSMMPTLTGYARAFSGNQKVIIEIAAGKPRTDGDRILFRPPLELGDEPDHSYKYCNVRDKETGTLKCPACAVREKIMVQILHEISHIAEGTFAPVAERDLAYAVERAVAEAPGRYADAVRRRVETLPPMYRRSYLQLSGSISPFLPSIVNVVEDARINERLFQTRRGVRRMFETFMKQVLTGSLGEGYGKWIDSPLNAQVVVALFCRMGGYDIEGAFAPEIEVALQDPQLQELCAKAVIGKDAAASYELSFPILARLRELGFCRAPEDPEPPEEPQQDEQQESESQKPSDGDDEGEPESEPENGPSSDSAGSGEGESPEGSNEEKSDNSGDGSGEPNPDSDDDSGEGSDGDKSSNGEPSSESSEDTSARDDRSGDDAEPESSDGDTDSSGDDETGQSGDAGPEKSGDDQPAASDDQGTDGGLGTEPSNESTNESGDGVGDDQGTREDVGTDQESSDSDSGGSPQDGNSDDDGESDGGERSDEAEAREGDSDSESCGEPSSSSAASDSLADTAGESGDAERSSASSGTMDNGSGQEQPDRSSDGSDNPPSEESSSSVVGQEADEPRLESDEVIDTGADDGEGGVKAFDPKDHNMGTPDEINDMLQQALQHGEDDKPEAVILSEEDLKALEVAIAQSLYFETESRNVNGVRINTFSKPGDNTGIARHFEDNAWSRAERMTEDHKKARGVSGEFDPSERVLGPALLKMRAVFADNRRGSMQRNLKSGRISGKVLGKRAPVEDPRMFRHKTLPGKKDYAVVIGMDISGSNHGMSLILLKRAVMAQANLLERMGIDFTIIAHSGVYGNDKHESDYAEDYLDIYIVKGWKEPWAERQKDALRKLGAYAYNLDGHALEYLRKEIEKQNATDKVIMYYSDGKMPAENYQEELEVLQREIRYCRRRGIKLLGVGIRTDSPTEHGLDTVEVNTDEDITKVVKHLEKHLS